MSNIYSISNDTLNGSVALNALKSQIESSIITRAIDSISTSGDDLTITFKASIATNEKTELDSIISLHDGVEFDDDKPVKFEYQLPQGGQRVTDRGFSFTALANTVTTFDYSVSEDLYIKQGFLVAYGYNHDDAVTMAIAHVQLGELHNYVKDFPLKPTMGDSTIGIVETSNAAITETNFNGLIIRIKYNNTGNTDLDIGVGIKAYS